MVLWMSYWLLLSVSCHSRFYCQSSFKIYTEVLRRNISKSSAVEASQSKIDLWITEPSHPERETHCTCLYSWSHSFGHYPELMTMTTVRVETYIVWLTARFAFWLSSHFTTTDRFSVRITADAAPICLSISSSIFPSLVDKTQRYFNSSTPYLTLSRLRVTNPHFSSWEPRPRT